MHKLLLKSLSIIRMRTNFPLYLASIFLILEVFARIEVD